MTYYLFLDDERMPGEWYNDKIVILARNYKQFCHTIEQHGWPIHISFDCDLGTGPSGADCAKWMLEFIDQTHSAPCFDFSWTIHSQNPDGAARIRRCMLHLEKFLRYVSP